MAASPLEENTSCTSATNRKLSEITVEIDSIPKTTNEKKKVSFKENFVDKIDVENWKIYNCDCSENPSQWNRCKSKVREREGVICNCILL